MSGADATEYGVATDSDGASGLFAEISVDLIDGNGDGKWAIGKEALDVVAEINAYANVDLGARVSIEGTGISLPEVTTVIHYDQTFVNVRLSSSSGSSASLGGSPSVVFENVTLDLGKALSGFVGPIADELGKYIGPGTTIRQLVDILVTPIDLGVGQITLIDILASKYPAAKTAVNAIVAFSDFIGLVENSEGDSIKISFGDFTVGGSLLGSKIATVSDNDVRGAVTPDLAAATANKPKTGQAVAKFGTTPGSIQFPILTDPKTILGFMMGRTVTLFSYDLPSLDFEVGYKQSFPVFPGLNAFVSGTITAKSSLSFGFDTRGINEWKDSGFDLSDIDDIFDGFYFGDWNCTGAGKRRVHGFRHPGGGRFAGDRRLDRGGCGRWDHRDHWAGSGRCSATGNGGQWYTGRI